MVEIKSLLSNANDSFKGKIFIGDDPDLKIKKISSGIKILDDILGGGVPRGRSIVISGEFSTGKTFLTQKFIETSQKDGLSCVFIDAEKAVDPEWFKMTGIDLNKLIVARPNTGEEGIDMIIHFLKENVDLIVLDSLAALVPSSEINENMEQQFIGLQSRLINKGFRKILAENNNTVFIAINQLRESIGKPGIFKSMPGGKGQYFFSSIILEVSRKEWIKNKEDQKVGFIIRCLTSKNKLASPFQTVDIPFNFITGQVDYAFILFEVALEMNLITKQRNTYMYGEVKLGVGKDNSICTIQQDDKLMSELRKKVNIK